MKARELAELLLKNPDFEVRTTISYHNNTTWGISYASGNIIGIAGIGYSSSVILLDNDIKIDGVLCYDKGI